MNVFKKEMALLLLLVLLTVTAFAQKERYTEEEVNIQKLFIEATREKLLRKYENAAYLFEEVTKKDKNNPAPYYELAKVYDILDKSEKAIKSIKTAIKLDGQNNWYRVFLAELHEKNDRDIDAAKVYEQLVQNDIKNEYYYFQWAYFLVKSGEGEKAIIVFDNLEKLTGITPETSDRKHKIYHQLGKRKEAAKELSQLADAYPDNLTYKHALARYFEQIGSRKNAKVVYQQIIKKNPEDAKAEIALASYTDGKQKNDLGYLGSLTTLFKKKQVLIDVKIAKLFPYTQSIATEQDPAIKAAILDLAKLLTEIHPTAAKSYSIYGDLLYQTNDLEGALEQYKKTLAEDDTVFPVWENSMEIYHQLGQYEALIDCAEQAMDLFPNRGASYYYSGLSRNEKLEYKEAVSDYQLALMMSGKDAFLALDIYAALATTYTNQKQFNKAKGAIKEGLKLNPASALLLEQYGDILFQNNEETAAIQQWKKALALNKNSVSLEKKITNRSL